MFTRNKTIPFLIAIHAITLNCSESSSSSSSGASSTAHSTSSLSSSSSSSSLDFVTLLNNGEPLTDITAAIKTHYPRYASPLSALIATGQHELATLFIEHPERTSAHVNVIQPFSLQTPLHFAVIANNWQLVSSLILADADTSLQDYGKKTPLDRAQALRETYSKVTSTEDAIKRANGSICKLLASPSSKALVSTQPMPPLTTPAPSAAASATPHLKPKIPAKKTKRVDPKKLTPLCIGAAPILGKDDGCILS